jgi:3-(3-hydroxy-phenyl)propionate hydroxylase
MTYVSPGDLSGQDRRPTQEFEVIVAGGGPVGAVAAFLLARAGVHVLLLEAGSTSAMDLRASTLHPPTLDMLSDMGLLERLLPQGLRAPVFQYRNMATGDIVTLDMAELADRTAHPYRLQCEQWKLAQLASAEVGAHPSGTVLFSHRLVSFSQDESGVIVHAETAFTIESFRARYLVACDGGNSIIRKWLGIEFEGFTYPEKFLCLSTDHAFENDLHDLAYVNYIADPTQWMVLLRTPSVWRILVPASQMDPDDLLLSDATKNAVIGRLVADHSEEVLTEHRTIYRVHQRVAQDYRQGRVLLAGDAAHLNNPLGGFGMNSGIHDVWNLTQKLTSVLRQRQADGILDLYTRQRQTVMREFVQSQSIRNKKMLEMSAEESGRAYETELRQIVADPKRRKDYLMTQSMYRSLEREAEIH